MMIKTSKIYIAGHNGIECSAIRRNLEGKGFSNIMVRSSKRNQKQVKTVFSIEKPELVFFSETKA